MRLGDGLQAKYSRGGDLQWLSRRRDGQLDGLCLRFEPEGFLRYSECGVYSRGKLVEKWQTSLLPDGFLALALSEFVLPVKRALSLGLSTCEARLCREEQVDLGGIRPMALAQRPDGQAPEVPQIVSGKARRQGEWWRPQLEVADPSTVYGVASPRRGEFAPVGPGCVGEVRAFAGGFPYLRGVDDGAGEAAPPEAEAE